MSERVGVVAISLVVILVQAFYDSPHLMWLGALRALRCVCVAEGVDVGAICLVFTLALSQWPA